MKSVKKILVVCLDNLGDSVMASALLPALRNFYPEAQIGFWVKDYVRDIFSPAPWLDKLHSAEPFWGKSPGGRRGSISNFIRSVKEIKQEKYELVFVLNTEWRRSLAAMMAGIPQRVGYARRKSSPFLTLTKDKSKMGPHFVDDHLALLAQWLDKEKMDQTWLPTLSLSSTDTLAAETWKKNHDIAAHRLIVFHCTSVNPNRSWPFSAWKELSQLMNEKFGPLKVVVIGNKIDLPQLNSTFAGVPNVIIAAGEKLSLVKGIIGGATAFVGVDSGPGHMAAALGIPVVSIFALDNWPRCGPRGKGAIKILHKQPIRDLSPQKVFEELISIIPNGIRPEVPRDRF